MKANNFKPSFFAPTERDWISPISSIEWGMPDRWSITSYYVHYFQDWENVGWGNAIDLALSPGWSGGRLCVGYTGYYKPEKFWGSFISQFRGVLLRTWGNPLSAEPDETYAGAEIKLSVIFINISSGYYYPLSDPDIEPFFGIHFGIGI